MKAEQSSHRKKILINISWLLLEHGVRLVTGVFSASILARVLGVEGYGMFNYILGLTLIFQSLSYINPAELMIPKLSNANSIERRKLMGNGFVIRLFFSLIAYACLLLFLAITDESFQFKLALILGLTILLNEAFAIITAYLQSQTIIKYRSRLVMFVDISKALVLISLYQLGVESIYTYAIVHVGQNLLIALGLLFIYRSVTKEGFFYFSLSESYHLIRQGLPFFIGIIFMIVFSRADIVFMRHLSDVTSLGLYASAIQLFNHAIVVAPILASSCAPLLVYKHQNLSVIKKNTLLLSAAMCVIGMLTAVALYYLAPILISVIFGDRFTNAIDMFQYLLIVLPLFFLNEGLNIYLIKMKLARFMIYKWLIVLTAAVIAYTHFIPIFNGLGAVIGYGIGYFLACLFSLCIIFFYQTSNEKQSHS
ncbi:MAG: oligosaccharide flippase family protein [Crenarchaeota archaeon]|nr:oligosaccharide flippase family protein [Thermoproteota archaeon]